MTANHARPSQPYAHRSLSDTAADLQRACLARDAEGIASLMAEQVVALYPQPQPFVGREANRQVWTAVFAVEGLAHPIVVDEVTEAEQGDLGYTFGRWWLTQPGAPPQGGRWLAVWQPMAEVWQITHLSATAFEDIASENPAA